MATMQDRILRNARTMRRRDQSEYDARISQGQNPNSPYMKQLKRSIDASQAKIDGINKSKRNSKTTGSSKPKSIGANGKTKSTSNKTTNNNRGK